VAILATQSSYSFSNFLEVSRTCRVDTGASRRTDGELLVRVLAKAQDELLAESFEDML
jgi:hypothetical protein